MTSSTRVNIENSLRRLQQTFQGEYGDYPIIEDNRPIGAISFEATKVHVTFRGSINSLQEIFSCLDLRKESLGEHVGLSGKVHKGIYKAFLKTHRAVLSRLQEMRRQTEIIVEGYSRGAGIATLMGAYLKKQFPDRTVSIFAYSPMKIFDRAAASDYERKVSSLYNFVCQEDLIANWTPSCLGFCSVGREYIFSAQKLNAYTERVRTRQYLHLRSGWLGTILKWIIPARIWEAHMMETYQEGARLALS